MRIYSNSFGITRQLAHTNQAIAKSLERLATGSRIVQARDDIAAYSISVRLESKIRGLAQAAVNVNQSKGLLTTADSALSAQFSIVQAMRELALQGANTTLSVSERTQINDSLNKLVQEFQQITSSTEFNGIKLIDGSLQNLALQVGANASDQYSVSLGNLNSSQAFQKFSPTEQFNLNSESSAGGAGQDIALEDLNSDGILDQIYISSANSNISVALGNGDGSFKNVTTFAGLSSAVEFKTGDLNGDGIQDLALASGTQINTYLGDGEGGFNLLNTVSSGGLTMASIEITDNDQDGDLDIVGLGTEGFGSIIRSFENDGNGNLSFGAGAISTSPAPAIQSTLADVDGDGIEDLLYLTGSGKSSTESLVIRLANGDGSYGVAQTYNAKPAGDLTARTPITLAAGDLDNDGDIDVIVGNSGSQIVGFINDGTGLYAAAATISSTTDTTEIKLADVNSDGVLDIVAAGASSYLAIFNGVGDGTFSNQSTHSLDSNIDYLDIGDLNGDGVLDVIALGDSSETISNILGGAVLTSALPNINVNTAENAEDLLNILDRTADLILSEQAKVGAYLSRLDFTESSNLLIQSNYEDALDRISSVDYSLEIAELVKNQILQQAQIAALAQANLNLQVVLQLLDFNNFQSN